MSSELDLAKRPISPMLAGPYGHPIHPILVTVPIGAWVAGFVFDIASHVVDEPGFLAQGTQWLIAIGIVGALAAGLFGLLDLLVIPARTAARRTALTHMVLNLAAVTAFVVNFIWRRAGYGDEAPVAGGPIVLSALALAALGVSGYLGGTLSYRYGVRVVDERTQQAEGFTTQAPELAGRSAQRP